MSSNASHDTTAPKEAKESDNDNIFVTICNSEAGSSSPRGCRCRQADDNDESRVQNTIKSGPKEISGIMTTLLKANNRGHSKELNRWRSLPKESSVSSEEVDILAGAKKKMLLVKLSFPQARRSYDSQQKGFLPEINLTINLEGNTSTDL